MLIISNRFKNQKRKQTSDLAVQVSLVGYYIIGCSRRFNVGTLKGWIVSDIHTHSYCRQLAAVKT